MGYRFAYNPKTKYNQMKHTSPKLIVVDLFCGFGGTTTGYKRTNGLAKVIACVNHDPKAIKSHWMNYPDVKHFEEDIRTLELQPLRAHLDTWKAKYPAAKVVLWASLECTNFSKAKGGLPRDADSRTLADHLHRYITALDPDFIKIENVVEFMSWGPLDQNGKPESRKNGQDWMRWRKSICEHGYFDQWQEMNSANYGAYTSRNRLFGCFAKHGLIIAFPEPTHAKVINATNLFANQLKPWMPVRDVLHLDEEGESIFTRKKPLSEKTLERIYAGLKKFVAGGDKHFIAKYYSGRPEGKVISTDGPAGTIRTSDGQALVSSTFLLKYNSTNKNGQVSHGHSIESPCPVVSTQGRLGIVKTQFMNAYYGNSFNSDIEGPCPTISTKDRFGLISANQFINRDFTNGGESQSIDMPAGSVMPNPKMNLVTAKPFIMDTQFNNGPRSIDEPAGVITANRKHHYIVNPSYWGHSHSIEGPCPVIVARQDKSPLYIVNAETGEALIPIHESDSECMLRIKSFMAAYGIIDIKMRMLMVPELLKIQGFPEDYKMSGNQTDAKKFIGNSVVPHVVTAWTERMAQVI
jgi:DNA (cytosine-5)-methyltransferase 1